MIIRLNAALAYSWIAVSDSFEAGNKFIEPFKQAGAKRDVSAREISVALRNEALTTNIDVLQSFTFVDFIVSSSKWIHSIQERGVGLYSSDAFGIYSTHEAFKPYIAASILFHYFRNTNSTSNDTEALKQDHFVRLIIGNGICPAESRLLCQNGNLRPNSEYWYILSLILLKLLFHSDRDNLCLRSLILQDRHPHFQPIRFHNIPSTLHNCA